MWGIAAEGKLKLLECFFDCEILCFVICFLSGGNILKTSRETKTQEESPPHPPPTYSKGNMKTQEMRVMEERIFVLDSWLKGFVLDNTRTTTLLLCCLSLLFFNKAL